MILASLKLMAFAVLSVPYSFLKWSSTMGMIWKSVAHPLIFVDWAPMLGNHHQPENAKTVGARSTAWSSASHTSRGRFQESNSGLIPRRSNSSQDLRIWLLFTLPEDFNSQLKPPWNMAGLEDDWSNQFIFGAFLKGLVSRANLLLVSWSVL